MTSAIVKTPNTHNHTEPGWVSWEYAQSQEPATPEEHADAIAKFGAGWHPMRALFTGGMSADTLFRLLRADYMRDAGEDGAREPVYLLMF